MGHRWKIEPAASFSSNAVLIIPSIYDRFMSHSETVMRHPRAVAELHLMRIEGKPLRYLMEVFQDRCGEPFKQCYAAIKDTIELMGDIHDCDVLIPVLRNYLQEIRIFNAGMTERKERISTAGIRELIRRQRTHRSRLFEKFCAVLTSWNADGFRERLVNSMQEIDTRANFNNREEATLGNLYLTTRTGS
jgi:CHAD domain-containing protein